ncbi:MAG TPA: hypothetical protein PLF92_12390 [Arenimonas sp.]|nr:hypothetical protein [Arenimonas sp.]HPW33699.1 hypothetical protein [Arenimonas sp.]
MKFIVRTNGITIDFSRIEQVLLQADPAAMIDVDTADSSLRVSTSFNAMGFMDVMANAGFPIPLKNLESLPSDCCGGCSG